MNPQVRLERILHRLSVWAAVHGGSFYVDGHALLEMQPWTAAQTQVCTAWALARRRSAARAD